MLHCKMLMLTNGLDVRHPARSGRLAVCSCVCVMLHCSIRKGHGAALGRSNHGSAAAGGHWIFHSLDMCCRGSIASAGALQPSLLMGTYGLYG